MYIDGYMQLCSWLAVIERIRHVVTGLLNWTVVLNDSGATGVSHF
jgi:hypothetical protein